MYNFIEYNWIREVNIFATSHRATREHPSFYFLVREKSNCHCEEERRSNRMDLLLIENLAIASLHFVTLAMTESVKKWDAPALHSHPNARIGTTSC